MLSIDIGRINFAFAILLDHDLIVGLLNLNDFTIRCSDPFPEFEIEANSSIVIERALVLKKFMDIVFDKYNINTVIIEKQSNNNIFAMSVQSMLVGICVGRAEIKLFNPKLKFTYLNLDYATKNKMHKRLSIHIAVKILKETSDDYNNDAVVSFLKTTAKKDDIADAIVMAYLSKDKAYTLSKVNPRGQFMSEINKLENPTSVKTVRFKKDLVGKTVY